MISCVSPGASCCEHTLNTLRYADRVKELKKETGLRKGKYGQDDIDFLANALMLPRTQANTTRIPVK